MFSRILNVLIRNGNIFCVMVFVAAIPDAVFAQAQTRASFVGQPQQSQPFSLQPQTQQQVPQQPQQDKSLQIARMFGPDTRPNSQASNASQSVTSSYPQQPPQREAYQLPEHNPLLPKDIPDEQRQKGVWSMESHQNQQARQQMLPQTPPPQITQTPQTPVSQPIYQSQNNNGNSWTPVGSAAQVRQASGDASETEATLAVQSPPPLAPPDGLQASGFGLQGRLRTSDFGLQG